MANLAGTKTDANLRAAFAGESQARNKYVYFAAKAKEEGYDSVSRFFEEAALNEQEHAKLWYKFLGGIGSTGDNLKTAIAGENAETTEMYPSFAKVARDEGFEDIAAMFEKVGAIEKTHEENYKRLLDMLSKDTSAVAVKWKCDNCGNIIAEKSAPAKCPLCGNVDNDWSGYKAYKKMA